MDTLGSISASFLSGFSVSTARLAYLDICDVCTTLTRAFQTQLFINIVGNVFGVTFMMLSAFNTLMSDGSNTIRITLYFLYESLVRTLQMYFIIDACHTTVEQVQLFILEMLDHKIEFVIYGFICLDFEMFVSIMGTIATYFLILVQLGSSPDVLCGRTPARIDDETRGPGISSCCYHGDLQTVCGFPPVPISNVPLECTSLVYDGAYINLYHYVCDNITNGDFEQLDKILVSGKSAYLYFGHASQKEWSIKLANETCNGGNNSKEDMKGLKVFFDNHPNITGLIIGNLEYTYYSEEFPTYTENLKIYLETMRSIFPKLIIGLAFRGVLLIDQFTYSSLKWLDIGVIASVTDFFLIDAVLLNECTKDFITTGLSPKTSSLTIYTLDKLKDVLIQGSFPKEKTYFKYMISPRSSDNTTEDCTLTLEQMCLTPQNSCNWCVETESSLNEKGKFANENGAGFMVTFIDINDPNNHCGCEKPYSWFYAILDGWNGAITKVCDLLKRD
ncbi:uncharacterized protein LOC113558094 [Rhopalosiphum maidis]|uniref:uncharacterized protein LOC113558094 n=1 Tax=Rhopalosiphum maidis TaxID=43146 RepID=UPI000EFE352B|nr:uncharacterized protein LOC113558094 [Rhopalosiphum maidis]